MLDHIGIRVGNLEASKRFYDAALLPLGISIIMEVPPELTGGYHSIGYGKNGKPFFWVSDGGPHGAGIHVAFVASSRSEVDAFHKAALKAGGKDNGGPGLRPHYHPNYYGAFVFDPDGINLEAVCHSPQ
ncbi:MAG TPA: VOC family protein [Methylovirgula sp.]|nr:VOC family protein [Methylovirgula sp.]